MKSILIQRVIFNTLLFVSKAFEMLIYVQNLGKIIIYWKTCYIPPETKCIILCVRIPMRC